MGHWATRRYLFLTPDATSAEYDAWEPVSYRLVRDAINHALAASKASVDMAVLLALNHYKTLLATHVIDDPELDKLCDDIMRKHGPALRLLFQRVETPRKAIANAVKAWIAEHAQEVDLNQNQNKYISFVPKSWNDLSPLVHPKGDQKRRALAVLIEIQEECVRVAVELYGVDEDRRKWFHAIAKANPKAFSGHSTGHGKKFSTLYSVRHFGPSDFAMEDLEKLSKKVRKVLDEYRTIVLPRQTEAFRASMEDAKAAPLL